MTTGLDTQSTRRERAVYYFGCWGSVGHHLWTRSAESAGALRHAWGVGPRGLDGTLAPGLRRHPSGEVVPEEQREGFAALMHRGEWAALAFWDRSVDARYGSNSAFLFERVVEPLTFDEAERDARLAFPSIWARFRFAVRLAR